jgi:DNA-binding CsgD family transcriptional regulator
VSGVCASSVAPIKHEIGFMMRSHVDDEMCYEVAALTRAGCTAPMIAEKLQISTRTVQRIRGKTGCAERKAPLLTGSEILAAIELLEDGASYEEVGRTLGRNAVTIARNIPGYKLGKREVAERAALGRRMAALERTPHALDANRQRGKANDK